MLVHLPVLGTPLLIYIGIRAIRSADIKQLKTLYWGSLILAIITAVVYFSGPATADWVKEFDVHYTQELVENHALWGRFAFTISILSGVLGIMAVANYAQEEIPHKSIPWLLVGVHVLNLFIFLYTAHLGGLIRRIDLL
jgi:hypothetical protein